MKNKKGAIKLQSPFEKIKQNTKEPVERLYRAVIMQMIIDASNQSDKRELVKNEKEAKDWIFEENEFFDWACSSAGIEKSLVRKIAKQIIDRDF